jgi:uncharacterized lipoprotein YddW (UPF0748 family)
MKKAILIMTILTVLTSCTVPNAPPESITEELPYIYESSTDAENAENTYVPLNYSYIKGMWLPYTHFSEYMQDKSEDEYRNAVRYILNNVSERGINTVYFHVHPNGDAYYLSNVFPKGKCMTGDYDPLAILLSEAHDLGISVQAWMNPLRCQTIEEMQLIPDSFITKKWTVQQHFIKQVGDRWYLVPAYDEVRKLICDCADELLTKYDIDGIHIDDYFYPTTEPEFDSEEFAESGSSDLSQWRRECVTEYVKALNETVKKHGQRYKFSISPQGNIASDYDKQYADVKLWCKEGYCDYMIPQLYYGFKNAVCPFEATLHEWESTVSGSNVSLAAGLAEYKVGKTDKWAGEAGESEWIETPDIIERQIKIVNESSASGYVLYD